MTIEGAARHRPTGAATFVDDAVPVAVTRVSGADTIPGLPVRPTTDGRVDGRVVFGHRQIDPEQLQSGVDLLRRAGRLAGGEVRQEPAAIVALARLVLLRESGLPTHRLGADLSAVEEFDRFARVVAAEPQLGRVEGEHHLRVVEDLPQYGLREVGSDVGEGGLDVGLDRRVLDLPRTPVVDVAGAEEDLGRQVEGEREAAHGVVALVDGLLVEVVPEGEVTHLVDILAGDFDDDRRQRRRVAGVADGGHHGGGEGCHERVDSTADHVQGVLRRLRGGGSERDLRGNDEQPGSGKARPGLCANVLVEQGDLTQDRQGRADGGVGLTVESRVGPIGADDRVFGRDRGSLAVTFEDEP